MKIFAGYGSTKDISVYTSIGLPPSQIYIVGRPSKKMQHQCQVPSDHSMYNLDKALLIYTDWVRIANISSSRKAQSVFCKKKFSAGARHFVL